MYSAIPQSLDGVPKKNRKTNVENGLIVIEGDQVLITVTESTDYMLQVVDASGNPLQTLLKGTWNEGEHYLSIKNVTFAANNYLVLTRNGNILNKVELE